MQIGELCSQRFGLMGIGTFERPANRVDPIGDACKPGREHVEKDWMRDSRKTDVSATWMMWAIVSRANPLATSSAIHPA